MNLLRGVIDPELGSDIVELGMAKGVEIDANGLVTVTVALTTSGCPLRAQIQKDVRNRISTLPGVTKVKISWSELTAEEKAVAMDRARFNISQEDPDTAVSPTTKCIMVASGKGGVGKSSITVNLAAGLAARGMTVGVLDADIWGFSVPRMLGVEGRLTGAAPVEGAASASPSSPTPASPTDTESEAGAEAGTDATAADGEKPMAKISPNVKQVGDGTLKVVSMGFLVDNESASLNWRGLILNRAVRHFIEDVDWGELDYLLIDMPPGTGDVQMGLAKMLPRADMIVITTPARTAQSVAVRVGNMARSYYLRIAGVIENMTAFVNEEGKVYEIFGSGGGQLLAEELGVPLLGRVPIDTALSAGGDSGEPIVLGEGPSADALNEIVDLIMTEAIPPMEMAGCSARMLEAARESIDAMKTDSQPAVTSVTID